MTLLTARSKTVTVREMMRREHRLIGMAGVPAACLMELAGDAVARECRALVSSAGRICVCCGTGNNAGDALVAARRLSVWGFRVAVFRLPGRCLKGAAGLNERSARRLGIPFKRSIRSLKRILNTSDVVIDGLFGTGCSRPVAGPVRSVIELMNASGLPVISVDIPSGIDADTGAVMGVAVKALVTVTFDAPKQGMVRGHAWCGRVVIADIGLTRRPA